MMKENVIPTPKTADGQAGRAFLLAAFSLLAVYFLSFALEKSGRTDVFSLALLPLAALIFPGVFCLRLGNTEEMRYGNRLISRKTAWRLVPAFAALLLLSVFCVTLWHGTREIPYLLYGRFTVPEQVTFIVVFAYAILPAFGEEFLCRGILQSSVGERYGIPAAIFLSAFFFAVLSFSPIDFLRTFLAGALLALIRWQSGSFYASFLLSCAARIVLTLWESDFRTWLWRLPFPTWILAIAAGIVFFAAVFFALDRSTLARKYTDNRVEKQEETKKMFAAPAFWCAAVTAAVLTVFAAIL